MTGWTVTAWLFVQRHRPPLQLPYPHGEQQGPDNIYTVIAHLHGRRASTWSLRIRTVHYTSARPGPKVGSVHLLTDVGGCRYHLE